MNKTIAFLLALWVGFVQSPLALLATSATPSALACSCCCQCGGNCDCVKPAGQDRPPAPAAASHSFPQTKLQFAAAPAFLAVSPVIEPATTPRASTSSPSGFAVPLFARHCALLI